MAETSTKPEPVVPAGDGKAEPVPAGDDKLLERVPSEKNSEGKGSVAASQKSQQENKATPNATSRVPSQRDEEEKKATPPASGHGSDLERASNKEQPPASEQPHEASADLEINRQAQPALAQVAEPLAPQRKEEELKQAQEAEKLRRQQQPQQVGARPTFDKFQEYKTLIWVFSWLGTLVIIVILLILMMVRNVVPQASGIELWAPASITYFILTVFNLMFLFMVKSLGTFGEKSSVFCGIVFSILWGIVLLTLGIILLAVEIPNAEARTKGVWENLSINQKKFFGFTETEQLSSLQYSRVMNTGIVGGAWIFAGLLFCLIGSFLICFYYQLDYKFEDVKETKHERNQMPLPEDHMESRFLSEQIQKQNDQQWKSMQGTRDEKEKLQEEQQESLQHISDNDSQERYDEHEEDEKYLQNERSYGRNPARDYDDDSDDPRRQGGYGGFESYDKENRWDR